jgi:NADH-quinone oxidoreductase subunit E
MSVNETGTDTKKAEAKTDNETIDVQVDKILSGFTGTKSEAIPILQQVQQALGYLPQEALERVAKFIRVPYCNLFGVATFYAQFKLTPTGKNVVRVCRGTACHVRGGDRILKEVEKRLGIKPGQNTPDMEYALETVACIGACALAPTMTINNDTHGEMTAAKVAEFLPNKMEEKKSEETK